MMNKSKNLKKSRKEIINFICKTCNAKIDIGACGTHREQTGHRDFYEIKKQDLSTRGKEIDQRTNQP